MSTFVVFDHSYGDPPRQLTIAVHAAAENAWELKVTSEPPAAGALLVSFGTLSFGGRFATDGTTVIRNIPAVLLADDDGPELELAILPLGVTAVGD
jgi:hypothetical protein